MSESASCPRCGNSLPDGRTHGLCPACLMEQAMASRTFATDSGEKDLPAPPSPEEIADRFPQFEVIECLGRGGMGVVYKARQKSLDRWVAIKILHHPGSDEARFASHFEKEARTLARMTHPNIVTVFDHGEADGLFYIVMEFVDGVNLRDLLREGKMEPEQALAIVPPICEALEYAHDKGVVHRDIKPENLLLDREGRVKIADFGIASLVGAAGEKSGTPPYMAPEQKDGIVDRRADIYALGAVLYEMLTGERPTKDLVAPSKRVEVDVKIDEMVLRALEKEPERRYQTAEEFRTVVQTMATARTSGAESDKAGGPQTTEPAHSKGAGWKVLRFFSALGVCAALLAVAGFVFLVGVVPYWQASWADQGRQLPGFQILLVNLSQFCRHFWPLVVVPLLLLAVGSVVGLVVAVRRPRRAAISESSRVDTPLAAGKVGSEKGEQTARRFFKHIRILSTSYQILGILLMIGAFILPIPVGLTLAQDKVAWNEIVPLMIATGFGCLLGLGFGGYFLYVGHALRTKHRYALGRVAAIILLVVSILTFPPLAALAIYTLIILNKDAVAKAGHSTIKPASTVGSKSKPRGMFGRLWWLFLGMLVLGPLVGAVAGLGVLKSTGVVHSTERTVIDLNGSPQEVAAIATRVTEAGTLDRVSKKLQLAHAWNCQPADVAPRLRRMIRVEPIRATTLIRIEVDHFNQAEAVPIADAIAEVLADQPERPAITVVERSYAVPSKARSALPVLAGAILGFLLSPLLALAVMTLLHRQFPEPRPRRWTASVASMPALAFLVTMGIGIQFLSETKTRAAEQVAPGPVPIQPENSPEHVARAFMEAMRDGDIDAAMALLDPEIEDRDRMKALLAGASDELRREAYVGNLDRLTEFTEWYPESWDEGTRFLVVRVAAPSGGPEAAVKSGLYLILTSTPNGWRVAHTDDAGKGSTLAEYLDRFLGQKVLSLPVTPPLAMKDDSSITIEQVRKALAGVSWGEFLAKLAVNGLSPDISTREVASQDGEWRCFEVAFRYQDKMALLDLRVDPEFRRVEPTRLRKVASPDRVTVDAAVFLPPMAFRYTYYTADASLLEEIDARTRWLKDVKTMEGYAQSLGIYRGSHDRLSPPDLDALVTLLRSVVFHDPKAGLMQNYETGTMELPLYHGNTEVRREDDGAAQFILLAAPSANRDGKRLVLFLDSYDDRTMDEEDYLKQLAKQAKTAGHEQVARCFMEAIRSRDLDTAMVWLTPEMKQGGEARVSLELLSKQLRDEVYAAEAEKLTEFSDTSVVKPDAERTFFAARVALPEGEAARAIIDPGLVLILGSTVDGWRVAHFDAARTKRSLSAHVMAWIGKASTAAEGAETVRRVDLMDVDARDAGPTVLDLASGKLLEVPEEVESEADFNAHFNRLGKGDLAWDGAILTLRGARLSERIDDGWTLRNPERENDGCGVYHTRVPARLRITTAESEHFVVDVREEIGNGKGVRVELRPPHAWLREVIVGKWQAPDGKTRIEFFPDGTMAISNGSITVGGNYTFLDDGRVKTVITVYGTSVVEIILISVNGDVMTTIDERGNKEELKRVPVDDPSPPPPETGKNAPEATRMPEIQSPPEGAEIRRFVLDLPVQPPLAMPKDAPLTIDQVKEVLKGVTWGELLAALAEDDKGDDIAVREIPSPGEKGSRYEITFRYGNGRMLMELAVDWKFRSAEPSRLRPVGMPGKVLSESAGFLPQMAIRYAMRSGHDSAAPAVEEARAQARQFQDSKTLKQYITALIIYSEEMGSYPPDLAFFFRLDFPGKKRWEGLLKDGLMHNHQTGEMERPIYHGYKDLRASDHDVARYILIAAPSADPQGKRLVAHLDGSVNIIDEQDYRKQVRKQAEAKAPGQAAIPKSGIRVVARTASEWVINYTSDGKQSLSLWTGTRDNAGYLIIPEGSGTAKLKATREGLVLETGSQRVGPIPLEAFSFAKGNGIVEPDGSVIVGKCSDGVVGIRLEKDSGEGTSRTMNQNP